jgi:hypothetical protein
MTLIYGRYEQAGRETLTISRCQQLRTDAAETWFEEGVAFEYEVQIESSAVRYRASVHATVRLRC